LVVNPAALTVTASGATKTYGNSINLTGFTSNGLVNGDSVSAVSLTSTGAGTTVTVGSYTISASGATGTGLSNYSISYANGTLVVNPAALTVTASGASKTYGNSISLTGFTSNGLVNGDSVSGVSLFSSGTGTAANAGSYTISASGATGTGLSNYSVTYANGTLVVDPAALTVTASGATKTYGNSISLTGFTSSGLINGDSISAVSLTSTGAGTASNVGSYTISASGATGTGLSNYSISYAEGTLVVNPAALTVTASGATKTYGNSINLTGFTSNGLVNGDSVSAVSLTSTGAGTTATVGSYTISGSGATGTGLSNYSITYASGTLTVNPAALTVTASGATKTYGNALNLTGFTSNGLVNGDTVTAVSLSSSGAGAAANVGSYSIVGSAATGTGLSNYSITYTIGTLVVDPAALTITASDATKIYGTGAGLTGFTSNGLVNGDRVTAVSLTSGGAGTAADVGSYSIVGSAATGTGLSNYAITYTSGILVVDPAALTITAGDAIKAYGNAISLTGYSANGLVNGDSIGAVTLTSDGSAATANIGQYAIQASGATGAKLANYNITYAAGALTVGKAILTVKATDTAKTYGSIGSLSGFTISGLLDGDNVSTVTLSSDGLAGTAAVGSYTISASNVAGSGLENYAVSYIGGTLTVTPATLTITAGSATKTYGDSASLTGFSVAGLLNGDSVGAVTLSSLGADADAAVGSYAVSGSAATGTGLSNYAITYATGTLLVNPAALTIGAANTSKVYGSVASLSGFTASGLMNGDRVEGLTLTSDGNAATATVGSYSIRASGATGSKLSNYTITYVDGALTVDRAALTISANNVAHAYGTAGSLAGYSVAGLVNGDQVTGATLSTNGLGASIPVGQYRIEVSDAAGTGLGNYTISYASGMMTVTPASLTITAGSLNKTYGTSVAAPGYTVAGLVNGDSVAAVNVGSQGLAAAAAAGNYTITASDATGTGLSNYAITYVAGTLLVNPAALTISAGNAAKTYGTNIGLTGFSAAGLLNGDSVGTVALSSGGTGTAAAVGSYGITASGATGTGLSNYAITYVAGTLLVNPAALTISAGNAAKTYGTNIALTGFSAAGLVNGDSVGTVALSSGGTGTAAAVGSYGITASGATGTGLSNYAITYVGGTLLVNPAALTITAGNAAKTYGSNIGLTGFSAAGLVNGDSVGTVALSSGGTGTAAAAGLYGITASGATGTGLSNYAITYVGGTLLVNPAALTISAGNASKVSGSDLSLTAFSASGLVNGDAVSSVTLSSAGTPASAVAGTYAIVASNAAGTGLGNYSIRYQEGQLTVTPAASNLTTSAVQRIVVAAVTPTVTIAATSTPANMSTLGSTVSGSSTATASTASSSTASSTTTSSSSSGPATESGGGNGGGASATNAETGTASGTTGGGSPNGEALPILVSGGDGGETVYSQIQMTSDPIKGSENDERQQ
ncbi:MAG: beta strand repeat-containing protein, partial [Niveispirillum sp.]|uniref:beta strand repeat-containing protein n=1 Tax=Niveispirillum sp. TaxID=1917217 RepID=UPI003BA66BBF